MTQEALKARQAELDGLIQEERRKQAQLGDELRRLEAQRTRSRDMENTLGGAKQECANWAALLAKNAEAPQPSPVEEIRPNIAEELTK